MNSTPAHTDDHIRYERSGSTAIITMDRPDAMNALTPSMRQALVDAFDQAAADDAVRAIVVTGAGERAFCAGADLGKTIPTLTSGKAPAVADPTRRWLSQVFKPVIAAVNGHCLAAGMEMLQGTDLRIAAEHATFGLPEVRWGIVPTGGSHVRLPRQVPWAVAMEMLLLGGRIDARRAYDIGLVNKVVPLAQLMEEALRWAELAAQNGPLAVRTAKEIAMRSFALEGPFALEASMSKQVFASEDAVEGPRAFMEKRKPDFKGR